MADQVTAADVRAATGGWWLLALTGVLSIAAGVTILVKPGDSLATLAVIAGIFLLVDGILELAASLMHGTQSRGTRSHCSGRSPRSSASCSSATRSRGSPRLRC